MVCEVGFWETDFEWKVMRRKFIGESQVNTMGEAKRRDHARGGVELQSRGKIDLSQMHCSGTGMAFSSPTLRQGALGEGCKR